MAARWLSFPIVHIPAPKDKQSANLAAQAVYVVNDRTNGQVEVTIRATLLIDRLPGTTTSMDQVLTLAAGERRELGCLVYPPQTRTTWDLVDCHSL